MPVGRTGGARIDSARRNCGCALPCGALRGPGYSRSGSGSPVTTNASDTEFRQ